MSSAPVARLVSLLLRNKGSLCFACSPIQRGCKLNRHRLAVATQAHVPELVVTAFYKTKKYKQNKCIFEKVDFCRYRILAF